MPLREKLRAAAGDLRTQLRVAARRVASRNFSRSGPTASRSEKAARRLRAAEGRPRGVEAAASAGTEVAGWSRMPSKHGRGKQPAAAATDAPKPGKKRAKVTVTLSSATFETLRDLCAIYMEVCEDKNANVEAQVHAWHLVVRDVPRISHAFAASHSSRNVSSHAPITGHGHLHGVCQRCNGRRLGVLHHHHSALFLAPVCLITLVCWSRCC